MVIELFMKCLHTVYVHGDVFRFRVKAYIVILAIVETKPILNYGGTLIFVLLVIQLFIIMNVLKYY
tara:strand:- start:3565 stop:3762 length:198 start_codon:yes stop_codon:yes gene_type:complete